MPITSTLSGTKIKDGVEYNSYPTPSFLLKAMERMWVHELISNGTIRLNSIDFYQALENDELGDTKEGLGELVAKNHPYNTSSGNRVFIWCCAKPETDPSTLLDLDQKYDTIIRVSDPVEFTKRIAAALVEKGYSFSYPHLGQVNYNRSVAVKIDAVNLQLWHWNVFQKRESYVHQNEYRLAFTDTSFKLKSHEPIDLEIGPCSDIVASVKT